MRDVERWFEFVRDVELKPVDRLPRVNLDAAEADNDSRYDMERSHFKWQNIIDGKATIANMIFERSAIGLSADIRIVAASNGLSAHANASNPEIFYTRDN